MDQVFAALLLDQMARFCIRRGHQVPHIHAVNLFHQCPADLLGVLLNISVNPSVGFRPMSTLNLFHQGLWKLPITSPTSNSQNDDSLRKSIGEKNDKVVDLGPEAFWKIVAQSAGSDEISYVVVLCGDLIRDRTGD